jgi:predicted RNA binding protein with dsRBD fold (UPF0201 family)
LVHPTEDEENVRKAIGTVCEGGTITRAVLANETTQITAESDSLKSLTPFRDLLKRERVRSAARSIMFASIRGSTLAFALNKQVAYAGRISFATSDYESPLGPIEVTVQAEDPAQVVDWLAPPPNQR